MTDQTPEPTELTYDAMMGADLHDRGALSWVLDDALTDAVATGTGWIRVRFRRLEDGDGVEPAYQLGDWTLDSPDPAQVVEVVTVVAQPTNPPPAEEDVEGTR